MNAKRLFTILNLLIILVFTSACSQKAGVKTVFEENASDSEKAVEKVVNQDDIISQQGVPSVGRTDNDEQTSASGEVAMLNYQSSSMRMVIKDAELELLVENTNHAIDQVTQLAADYGGYLLSSSSWFDGEFMYATIRMAVPSQDFETALTNLRHFGVKVVKETSSGQDVSAEYTDLQSRLTNLEATAARVREFLNEAKTVEESLKVNQQLSDLEVQIEQIKGQMNYYEGRTAFSTITVNLVPQRPTPTPSPTATPTPKPSWNPGKTVSKATNVLSTLLRATVELLIWMIIVFGPFALVFGLILLVLDHFLHLRARLRIDQRQPPSPPPATSKTENHTPDKSSGP